MYAICINGSLLKTGQIVTKFHQVSQADICRHSHNLYYFLNQSEKFQPEKLPDSKYFNVFGNKYTSWMQ